MGAWDGAVLEGTADVFLVAVDRGGVNVTVAPLYIFMDKKCRWYMRVCVCSCSMFFVSELTYLECLCHGGIACFALDLESAKPYCRHGEGGAVISEGEGSLK